MLNNVISYCVHTSSKGNITIKSAGDYFGGTGWNRSGTVLTITSSNHGLNDQDFVMIRNANEDYLYAPVSTSMDDNVFTVGCNDVGATVGEEAAYITAFSASVTNDGVSGFDTITLGAPFGISSSIQMLSMNVNVHDSVAGQFSDLKITLPQSLKNGGFQGTEENDITIPLVQGYKFGGSNTVAFSSVPKITYASGYNKVELVSTGQGEAIYVKVVF